MRRSPAALALLCALPLLVPSDPASAAVDTTPPVVTIAGVAAGTTYFGEAPAATCAATDDVTGPVACTIAVTTAPDARHHATGLTATAVDAAGNTGTATVTYSVETTYLPDAVFRKDLFVVKRARKYVVIAYAASTPRILLPASVPTTPTEKGPRMKRIGTSAGGLGIYRAKVEMTRSEYGPYWYLGTQTDTLLETRLKPSGKRIGPGPADL